MRLVEESACLCGLTFAAVAALFNDRNRHHTNALPVIDEYLRFFSTDIIMLRLLVVALLVVAAQAQAKNQRSSSYETADPYQQNFYQTSEYVK